MLYGSCTMSLKGTARVRAFFDLVGEGLASECDLFEGRRGAEDRP
jgi:hypothetical protein